MNIIISFKTVNNLKSVLKPRTNEAMENCSGVYRLQWNDCDTALDKWVENI